MLASLAWLRRICAAIPADPAVVADRLTMAGYVVAAFEPCGDDHTLDVEVTHNRPDLLSHEGLARELAGVFGSVCTVPVADAASAATIADTVPVDVRDGDLCPVYGVRVVRGVRVGPSPSWLVRSLEACGQRSVNNVVDVTNHVMLGTGQPLHAFDLAKLSGRRIVVRRGRGERLTAIDGRALELGPDDLAICDAEAPCALAGVMGGRDSEVSPATTDVLLESAVFSALAIRAASRRHQIHSESSHRFERFVDPAGVGRASDVAAQLLVDVCGARGVGPLVVSEARPRADPRRIELRAARAEHVLGVEVGAAEIRAILVSLGLRPEPDARPGATMWTVPSWRPDLVGEIDLIEEIGRRIGFDRVPEKARLTVRPRIVDRALDARRRVRDALVRGGLRECVSTPFISRGAQDIALLVSGPALRVLNPMRTGEDLLRRSLVGPLLATVRRNRDRDVPGVRIFEVGSAHVPGDGVGAARELPLVAGAVCGGYAEAKGCVETVLAAFGADREAVFVRGGAGPLRGDRSARVELRGATAGVVGELSARGAAGFGLSGAVSVFELSIDALVDAGSSERPYASISRFPAVSRDIAWVVDDAIAWRQIEAIAAGAPLVRTVQFLSEFRNDQIGQGRKSVAFRMELRSDDRTLTGEEADACVRGIVDRLRIETGGELRA